MNRGISRLVNRRPMAAVTHPARPENPDAHPAGAQQEQPGAARPTGWFNVGRGRGLQGTVTEPAGGRAVGPGGRRSGQPQGLVRAGLGEDDVRGTARELPGPDQARRLQAAQGIVAGVVRVRRVRRTPGARCAVASAIKARARCRVLPGRMAARRHQSRRTGAGEVARRGTVGPVGTAEGLGMARGSAEGGNPLLRTGEAAGLGCLDRFY